MTHSAGPYRAARAISTFAASAQCSISNVDKCFLSSIFEVCCLAVADVELFLQFPTSVGFEDSSKFQADIYIYNPKPMEHCF